MKTARNPHDKPAQPALGELFYQYLQRQVQANALGLGHVEPVGEVLPYEAVQMQPVDPQQAWEDGVAVLACFSPTCKPDLIPPPTDWPEVVAQHEPSVSLAFACCNFPGLVRSLQPFWNTRKLTQLCPVNPQHSTWSETDSRVCAILADWAADVVKKGSYPQALVAVGTLRLAKQFSAAQELLVRLQEEVPVAWQSAWANEHAALTWHQGQTKAAFRLWQEMPDSTPVLFNRGMAALFLGKVAQARPLLSRAVEAMPETSAWRHLGRFYLAVADLAAESRSRDA